MTRYMMTAWYAFGLIWFIVNQIYLRVRNFLQGFLISVLRKGPIPKHVAFIMDGNRRYALKQGLGKNTIGHLEGSRRLEQTLEWCFQLGIRTITLYAFSIENFKRPQEEIDVLMNLAVEKFHYLAYRSETIRKNHVAIRVLGELDMLPENVRQSAMEVVEMTKDHDGFVINICAPYTARVEQARAAQNVLDNIENGAMSLDDFTVEAFARNLHTWRSPPVDILVRTSGEHRLSEFLTWQVTSFPCQVEFVRALWPEFRLRHFVPLLLRYQVNLRKRQVFFRQGFSEKHEGGYISR